MGRFFGICLLCLLGLSGQGWAQDASLTVHLKAAGGGSFQNDNMGLTQVKVFTTSTRAAMYNGPTNIVGPINKTATGQTFSVTVPRLYSASAVPMNAYMIELEWRDTAVRKLNFGPVTLAVGSNQYGAGGLGNMSPIDVVNDAPPAATDLKCYQDPPDITTSLYVYWKLGFNRPVDFKLLELHQSRTAGFTPGPGTRLVQLPWATVNRKLTGLTPATDYYFCVRMVDSYDHPTLFTPKCTWTAAREIESSITEGSIAGAFHSCPVRLSVVGC